MSGYEYRSLSVSDNDNDDDSPPTARPVSAAPSSRPRPHSRSRSREIPTPLGPRSRASTSSPRLRTPSISPSPAGAARLELDLEASDFDVDFSAASGSGSRPRSRTHSRTGSSTSLLPPPPLPPKDKLPVPLPLPNSNPHSGHSPSSSTSTLSEYSDNDGEDHDGIEIVALPAPLPRSRSLLLQSDPPTPQTTAAPFSFHSSPSVYSSTLPYTPPPPPIPDATFLDVAPARPRYPRGRPGVFAASASRPGSALRPGHRRGGVNSTTTDSRTSSSSNLSIDFTPGSRPSSIATPSEKFDPFIYQLHLGAEDDDALHDPRVNFTGVYTRFAGVSVFTARGVLNLGCLVVLVAGLAALFLIYPLHLYFTSHNHTLLGSNSNSGSGPGVNATGQVPNIGNFGLVDLNTPKDAYSIAAYNSNSPSQKMQLVFSDEFEEEGRSFYPGDDPYWEAVDLHYWATGNLEWYDPSAITTRAGALEINLTKVDDPSTNHGLDYKSGMMSGLILADVMLPGATNVFGLWPALWTMGNLGRAGYGATLDGMWPYTYDTCDVGAAPNQSYPSTSPLAPGPAGATLPDGSALSFQPGQRLSRCVCKGESHPGPLHDEDGSFVGRSAPEIDVFEAQIGGPDDAHVGQVSQSAQWAPFNANYRWDNSSENLIIPSLELSHLNSYVGGVYQQPTSVVTTTNQDCYQLGGTGCFATQGFEYLLGFGDAYITWINNGEISWTLNVGGVGADAEAQISARPVTQEPLYILVNLGISPSFGFIDFAHLVFPATMRIDWIRVYQPADRINIGCDPKEMPTKAYIDTYLDAYTNPNYTTWTDDFGQPVPRNSLAGDC
ncbi:beta-glucan synthesis-associated protein-domain-containing protein [Mycena amicta]|nr:beta-glucan synthesis-associated protein-domain-containing protein [Mycena amicta]